MAVLPLSVVSDGDTLGHVAGSQFGKFFGAELQCPLDGATPVAETVKQTSVAKPDTLKSFQVSNLIFARTGAGWRLQAVEYLGPDQFKRRLQGRCGPELTGTRLGVGQAEERTFT